MRKGYVTLNISAVFPGNRKVVRSILAPEAMVEKDGANKVAIEYLKKENIEKPEEALDFKVSVLSKDADN